ncbi:glycosyltransferase involved in cell wall biosynthesis [Algoriphagus iocasae]|uniref:Glycosyltransferase involved in cell wall biosynthesis n=1 Tax=Algoriphagus iocasae TaxID=1836499 RepID=A0A841MYN8_9BACT|nr:glycosyltransferase family 2 protein [Algoriphagus iocasae]MBB6327748.1 glycosyltransferase involved in cell wall biosynthesis [Algoriphagus iocasae]
MLVSIITPVHNAYSHIEETIQSILNQTFQDWELILIDDYSTDSGIHILNKYEGLDLRIHLIENPKNLGAAISRNKGIEKAKGRFIAFLDSDDLWAPNKLEIQLKFMLDNKHAFTFTGYQKFKNGSIVGRHHVPKKVNHEELLKTCSIGCLTAMYDTEQLGKVYMPIISRRQDFALWLKILKMIPFAYGIDKPLAHYRLRDDSISGNKFRAARYQWRVYREFENLSFLKASYYFAHYAVFGVLKTYLHKAKK